MESVFGKWGVLFPGCPITRSVPRIKQGALFHSRSMRRALRRGAATVNCLSMGVFARIEFV